MVISFASSILINRPAFWDPGLAVSMSTSCDKRRTRRLSSTTRDDDESVYFNCNRLQMIEPRHSANKGRGMGRDENENEKETVCI